nr:MAG TPA: hypothetical protein [Bacteriophage sp.]DAH63026.1 MAG TPA: hypothetical protein [Bacteriophage sp.]
MTTTNSNCSDISLNSRSISSYVLLDIDKIGRTMLITPKSTSYIKSQILVTSVTF